MNKQRRSELSKAIDRIEQAREIIEDCLNEEQDYYDNCPENLQAGERYEQSENAISAMEEAIDNLNDTVSNLEETINN